MDCASEQSELIRELQPDDVNFLLLHAAVLTIEGEPDQALELLERAVALGLGRAELQLEPDLVPLQSHPRYAEVVELAH